METRWTQPFHWSVLTAGDADRPWDVPALSGNSVTASPTCLVVPVLHAQDVEVPDTADPDDLLPLAHVEVILHVGGPPLADAEFTAHLLCDSGRLKVGDAEAEREVEIPSGAVRIDVARAPVEFAEVVRLRVDRE